ncbi:osteoclast-stimulating factor 1-like [Dendronephthya gigantea]|uniref:osteoclast-stimulating factor 1-like n=1 Tax=Dendronephthya gigantea TaxID=151771 RepID=UPI00106ADF26|nr:osteoclast-stimulating factor 1-like [Dendronephthya gigantea]XP_028416954.1 osteoclast-stimulating factor 1-like [Dendronephthya gigantea]
MSAPRRAAPPPPSRPGQVQVVRALYRYEAQQKDELSFEEGDVLYIIHKAEEGWWQARVKNKVGLIPSNYVEAHTESVENPLHEAAKRGNVNFLNECLGNKVSVNGLDKAGCTPLHWAAQGGHAECVSILLQQSRIQINVQNKLGDTPLHSASWKGHPEIVKMLLDKGGDTKIKNNDKRTPYDLAKNPECGRLLRGAIATGADDDYGDDDDSD